MVLAFISSIPFHFCDIILQRQRLRKRFHRRRPVARDCRRSRCRRKRSSSLHHSVRRRSWRLCHRRDVRHLEGQQATRLWKEELVRPDLAGKLISKDWASLSNNFAFEPGYFQRDAWNRILNFSYTRLTLQSRQKLLHEMKYFPMHRDPLQFLVKNFRKKLKISNGWETHPRKND